MPESSRLRKLTKESGGPKAVCAEFLKQEKVFEIRSAAQEARTKLIRILRDNLNTLRDLARFNYVLRS